MTYDIKRNREHFEVYIDEKLYCTADNEKEAESEIKEYATERGEQNEVKSA